MTFMCLILMGLEDPWPGGYQTFHAHYSNELEIYPAHINVKMPTIVGILTFTGISMINTTSESIQARNFFI